MALPMVNRLKHRQDFTAVYQKGTRRSSAHLTLRALRQRSLPPPSLSPPEVMAPTVDRPSRSRPPGGSPVQLGVVVSSKVSKRAVVRNRIRRQLQGAFQRLLPCLAPGWKLVVVVKPNAVQCDYEEFLRELEQLLISAEVHDGHSRRGLL